MRAIMASIRPQHACNILNLIKLWEIRKLFPLDYVGWVYIYCTKSGEVFKNSDNHYYAYKNRSKCIYKGRLSNGVVVARFWCDKVEEIKINLAMRFFTKSMNEEELLKQSCLTLNELEDYILPNLCCGKAIHITKLEIFDRPKDISEFRKPSTFSLEQLREFGLPYTEEMYKDMATKGNWFITRAPQSWCYIEV